MKRKIIQMAGKTMVVSLPSAWVKKYGVKKGEEVEVEESGKDIIISTDKSISVSKKYLDLSDLEPIINRSIIEAYKKGHDELEIKYETKTLFNRIQKVIAELIGFEVIKQSDKSCIIKSVSQPSTDEFDNILRRLFLILKRMGEESLAGIEKNDKSLLLSVIDSDHNVNKFTNFCIRHINKRGYSDLQQNNAMFFIINTLESIGDEYKRLSKLALGSKLTLTRDLLTLHWQVNRLFDMYYEFFYLRKKPRAVEIAKLRDKNLLDASNLLKAKTRNEYEVVFTLLVINQLIISMLGPLLVFIEED